MGFGSGFEPRLKCGRSLQNTLLKVTKNISPDKPGNPESLKK